MPPSRRCRAAQRIIDEDERTLVSIEGRSLKYRSMLAGMEDLGIVQPRRPECGTVMRDDPRGFRCAGCGHLDDHSADLAAVVIPPEFDGPTILRD